MPDEKGLGGAQRLFSHWVQFDGHCVPGPAGCPAPSTLLLSGGDNYTGPAISSYFQGEPVARAMKEMGYAGAAIGNHEFDFGIDGLIANHILGGFPYLSCNVHLEDHELESRLGLRPYVIIERSGARIAVVGLTTDTTRLTAKASGLEGVSIDAEEPALVQCMNEVARERADAVILIAHECPDKLVPILARHAEFHFAFVGAGHCHKKFEDTVNGTPVLAPGWQMYTYARADLDFRLAGRAGNRLVATEAHLHDVLEDSGPESAASAPLGAELTNWKRRLDAALGRTIGYSKARVARKSPELADWVLATWRSELKTDLALINHDAIRQDLPEGPITVATVFSLMPFDDRLVTVSLGSDDIVRILSNSEGKVLGAHLDRAGMAVDDSGNLFDRTRRYTVATIDFIYEGGDGFDIQRADEHPHWIAGTWRDPVIAWLQRHPTDENHPLQLASPGGPAAKPGAFLP